MVEILIQLDKLIWKSCREFEDDEERISQAREIFRTLIVHLGLRFDECPKDIPALLAPLMTVLLDVRGRLRLAKQWRKLPTESRLKPAAAAAPMGRTMPTALESSTHMRRCRRR